MENIYLGRQPILDRDGNLSAYEVLYSEEEKADSYAHNDFRSAMVISTILNKLGTNEVLGERRAFIKIGEKFLLNDIVFTIPSRFFIFSLLEDVPMGERVVERLQQLKSKGFILALDEIALDANTVQKYKEAWSELSYVKVNMHAPFINNSETKEIIEQIKAMGVVVVGTKIEDEQKHAMALSLGCELFQGYFFAEPKIFEGKQCNPSQADILRLYRLLMEDTNIDEIAAEFEKNHAITLQLLRYINSGIFHFQKKIASIHHVLVLMGRTPLAQWLMFMIYAKAVAKGGEVSPLVLMVENRTELMRLILKKLQPDAGSNMLGQAYFVGVLSLLDTIFGRKIEDILEELHVDDTVKDALLYEKGVLGDIYALVKDIEQFHTDKVALFEKKYNLQEEIIDDLVLESMRQAVLFEDATKI
ncbi:MAG: EAL domain-containing protein [Sulfurimonas sp.]|uniref:EAL and HDOD domain-containing protein n=1 Tax=Sulfurimonas sp. TaxID=2022749 RepID=UPI0026188794|nr:EAL domain-containing protein [Sulfurimonas sp.]MDD2651863.1 EAL domain-containing protein [Sulfurimonas sp.]MDD3451820.1 EAL domain-containing protein [Sulfurimonas sp.]